MCHNKLGVLFLCVRTNYKVIILIPKFGISRMVKMDNRKNTQVQVCENDDVASFCLYVRIVESQSSAALFPWCNVIEAYTSKIRPLRVDMSLIATFIQPKTSFCDTLSDESILLSERWGVIYYPPLSWFSSIHREGLCPMFDVIKNCCFLNLKKEVLFKKIKF